MNEDSGAVAARAGHREPVRELFRQENLPSSDRDLAPVGLQDLGLQDKLRSRADALARSARARPFSK